MGISELAALVLILVFTALYSYRPMWFRVLMVMAGAGLFLSELAGGMGVRGLFMEFGIILGVLLEWKRLALFPPLSAAMGLFGAALGAFTVELFHWIPAQLGLMTFTPPLFLRILVLPAALGGAWAALKRTADWRARCAGLLVERRPVVYVLPAAVLGALGSAFAVHVVRLALAGPVPAYDSSAGVSGWAVLGGVADGLGVFASLAFFTQGVRCVLVQWGACMAEARAMFLGRKLQAGFESGPEGAALPGRGDDSAAAVPSAAKSAKATRAAAEGDAPAGALLGGKYELSRRIGEGGMGVVFEGRDKSLGRLVAVKKMRPELRLSVREKKRFMAEAAMAASLHHPCIVDIYAVLEEGDEVYLVFEFVDGETLEGRLDKGGRVPWPELRPVLKGVCDALAFAHERRIIHRDLKPSNIMVIRGEYAKVMDFGIARQMKDTVSRLTQVDTSGTLAYMAPEQELGRCDGRSDLYALAATVYEVLTGELPFPGPNFHLQKERMAFKPVRELEPGVPAEAASAVERCLRYDPKERFESVAAFCRSAGLASCRA